MSARCASSVISREIIAPGHAMIAFCRYAPRLTCTIKIFHIACADGPLFRHGEIEPE